MFSTPENLKIHFDNPGHVFTITNDKGFKYIFSNLEWTQKNGESTIYVSSWYLTKIVSPTNATVQFNYRTESTWSSGLPTISQTDRTGCSVSQGLISLSSSSDTYKNITLESIDFLNGKVHFYFDNVRNDYSGGKKLNKVTVFKKSSNKDSSEVFSYEMYYSYFNDGYSGNAFEYKRLKLDSVKQTTGNNKLPPYKFNYYDDPYETIGYTNKSSFNVDHWGYYNGAGNSVLFPSFWGYFNPILGTINQAPPSWVDLTGANRHPHITKQKIFSLQSVTYPTGGKTQFELEANDYDENNSFTGPTDFTEVNYFDSSYRTIINTRGVVNGSIDLNRKYGPTAWVTIAFRCSNASAASNFHANSGQIYVQIFGNTIDISSSNLTLSGDIVWATGQVANNNISSAAHSWSTYIAPGIGFDQFQDISISVDWKELRRLTKGFITGGGLRIKTITDIDAAGATVKKRKYDYHYFEDKNGDGVVEEYSYGRRLSHPSYIRYEMLRNSETGCMSLTRFSSSNISTTSSTSGNSIGYDKAIEWIVDPTNESNTLGKTVYTYHNTSDTVLTYIQMRLPGMNNISSSKNGMLKSKIEYRLSAGSYYKVAEEQNYYSTANRKLNYAMKYDLIYSGGAIGAGCTPAPNPALSFEHFGFIYPSIQSERILLDSTIKYSYENTSENGVKLKSVYSYTPAAYLQLSKTEVINSENKIQKTEFTYPYDHAGSVYDSLLARNMLSAVIEQKSFRNNSPTSKIKTNYSLWQGNTLVLPQTVTSATYSNQPESVVTFNNYDSKGNIQQYTARNGIIDAIIYDYNAAYPIAKVTNATLTDVAYTSFEADGKGNWSFAGNPELDGSAPTGKKAYNLNGSNAITKSVSSGLIYIVSYWTKNLSAFTIAGTISGYPLTGPTVNGWKCFVHKITGQSTLTVSGSGFVDELRLYPANAFMTTITYIPLIGVSSECDANNRIIYYEYDGFSRLIQIRDQDFNIVKKICYTYAGQTENCSTFYNIQKSGSFPRICGTDSTGSSVTYTVPANVYNGFTQAEADAKAQADVNRNGQDYANTMGTCTYNPPMISIQGYNTKTKNYTVRFTNNTTESVYNFTLPANSFVTLTLGSVPSGTYTVQFFLQGSPPPVTCIYDINGYTYSGTGATFSNISITATSLARMY